MGRKNRTNTNLANELMKRKSKVRTKKYSGLLLTLRKFSHTGKKNTVNSRKRTYTEAEKIERNSNYMTNYQQATHTCNMTP